MGRGCMNGINEEAAALVSAVPLEELTLLHAPVALHGVQRIMNCVRLVYRDSGTVAAFIQPKQSDVWVIESAFGH